MPEARAAASGQDQSESSGRWGPAAKQSPHRPGVPRAPGLRAPKDAPQCTADRLPQGDYPMSFSLGLRLSSRSLTERARRARAALAVEPLEERLALSSFSTVIADNAGNLYVAGGVTQGADLD